MKNILGLDLGPNSIGWAVVRTEQSSQGEEAPRAIIASGVRIIPMDEGAMDAFNKGNSQSQTKERTAKRSARRLYERAKLRRARLHRILALLHFLPPHYAEALDRYGNFTQGNEEKLAWVRDGRAQYHFLFEDAFQEMLAEFHESGSLPPDSPIKVPHDWTLYYLRHKALTRPVSREELAWILLSFNQKRGYFQLREEAAEKTDKPKLTREEFTEQTVTDILDTGETYKGQKILIVTLEDGRKGKIFKREMPNWTGQRKSIIITEYLDKEGNPKRDEALDGPNRRFRIPTDEEWDSEWELVKKKTEQDINESGLTVGEYIYRCLKADPARKVRGQLVRTIERSLYKKEMRLILERQTAFHPELRDPALYQACVEELYPLNEAHRSQLLHRDFVHLLTEDILFYQRPLKSKKSLINDCPYESHTYYDSTGEKRCAPIKCIAKSHPLFQEFRLWQFVSNLRLYRRDRHDTEVTAEYLPDGEARAELVGWLLAQKSIKQDALLKHFHLKADEFRWNYMDDKDKAYPAGETRALLLAGLKRAGIAPDFLTAERESALWHILYSISSYEEIRKALKKFAVKNGANPDTFCAAFERTPPFRKEYGSYSSKAIRKLLALMRTGTQWNAAEIDDATRQRIDHILTGEADDTIPVRVREKAAGLHRLEDFQGLPLWLACYVVYGRHSESGEAERWTSPDNIDAYLAHFKQHSLRNPIVESVVLETLRVVRDIWRQVGHIDEVHVEMAREMKLPAPERAKRTQHILDNERTKLRIKALLAELAQPDMKINGDNVEGVRPYSPYQQALLQIYEEVALNQAAESEEDKEIESILKKFNETDQQKRPTPKEVERYCLWLEQKYQSPYTGETIPLSKLFTPAYEIEHIIPRARYFDDSMSNKVICESEVNKLKDRQLGYEFIQSKQGEEVVLANGRKVRILSVEAYEEFVQEHYATPALKQKRRKLLMDDIPEDFIQRQLNDTRYITRLVNALLSNIVREKGEAEVTSKHVVPCTGSVTDRLKKDWGINDVWNRIILPRFKRLNDMEGTRLYTTTNTSGHEIPSLPLDKQKGFNQKRIDHRHHAMDAIVIACTSRNMVNFLNNASAHPGAEMSRTDLQYLLCEKVRDKDGNKAWAVRKPWPTFTQDVYAALSGIVPSFKQNLRVLTHARNSYQHYNEKGKKELRRQKDEKNQHWAIRKSLHKETYFGMVNLRRTKQVSLKEALKKPERVIDRDLRRKLQELKRRDFTPKAITDYFAFHKDTWQDIDLKKIGVYYFTEETSDHYFATRKALSPELNGKKIKENVTDTGIQKILLRHLEQNDDKPDVAFSAEGIERLNANITALNNGKPHKPIYKVRVYEKANKFPVGKTGCKGKQFVEANKGTNLFFAVYEHEAVDPVTGEPVRKRSFATIPLYEAIRRMKEQLPPAGPDKHGNPPAFVLSPGDLVYLPKPEETADKAIQKPLDPTRIYKMVSSNKGECYFIPARVAKPVIDKYEFSPKNKMERAVTGEMIKETCLPIKTDRLGNILGFITNFQTDDQ